MHLLLLGSILAILLAWLLAISDCDLPVFLLPKTPDNAFEDKVIWITGASSGIGAALATDLAMLGARVIMSARRKDKLQAVAASITGAKHKPQVLPLDVMDYIAQKSAIEVILQEHGRIDSVVLNAGKSQRSLAVNTSQQESRDILELNFFSTVELTRMVLPSMQTQKSGHIVVISSVAGKFGVPISSSYSASKYALQGYYDSLRGEIMSDNIKVTMINPGPVESEIGEHAVRDPSLPKMQEGKKMPTARCTELIAKAMHYGFEEVWISEQPFHIITYLMVYMPFVGRQVYSTFCIDFGVSACL